MYPPPTAQPHAPPPASAPPTPGARSLPPGTPSSILPGPPSSPPLTGHLRQQRLPQPTMTLPPPQAIIRPPNPGTMVNHLPDLSQVRVIGPMEIITRDPSLARSLGLSAQRPSPSTPPAIEMENTRSSAAGYSNRESGSSRSSEDSSKQMNGGNLEPSSVQFQYAPSVQNWAPYQSDQ